MKKRLFTSAKKTFLPPRLMWLGMLLACFAWIMQLSPLFAPLWLDKVSAGHGLCIKFAPFDQNSHQHSNQQELISQNSTYIHHENDAHSHSIVELSQADKPNNLDSDKQTIHDCEICLALFAFNLPTFNFKLIGILILAYRVLLQVLYRSLSQRLIAYLLPPSRASPIFHTCFLF